MWLHRCPVRLHTLPTLNHPPAFSQARNVHYQISSTGEKIVVSKRHNIKTKQEKWQMVQPMEKDKLLRQISNIEKNERLQSDPAMAKYTATSKMRQLHDRLQIAGFCRETKPYVPPEDVEEKIESLCKEVFNSTSSNVALDNELLKFKFLVRCNQIFDKEVPNSDLFQMKTVEDVKNFYLTPVSGKNNYDQLVQNSTSLPKNLQIIPEPIRFNPLTDTFFDGINAYPGRSNELLGLKAKKKYPVIQDNFVWPDV